MLENLVKAADIAKSLTSGMARNVPLVIAISISLGSLAAAPKGFLPQHIEEYRWLFASISFLALVFTGLQWRFAWRPVRYLKWYCRNLAADERVILAAYLKEDAACKYFFAMDGPVCTLIAKRVLLFASVTFDVFEAPVMIDPHVRLYLRKRPELVGLKTSDIGSEKPRGRLKTKSLIPTE